MGGRIWKQIPRDSRGKTSGAKVEDGTGFKAALRDKAVYQGTSVRDTLDC